MEYLNTLLSNGNTQSVKENPQKEKDQLTKENLIVYITSIEEWENYYINMYDFQLILKKDNPNFNKITKLIEINKVYSFSVINNNDEYVIFDIFDTKEVDYTEYNTTIKSITNDINFDTIIKTNPLSTGVILKRENKAYCGLYNELKLNIPCCLIVRNIHNKNFLIGISEVKILSKQIKVKGLINIGIEFNHLNDYQEVVVMDKAFQIRIVFQKHSFEFKVGCNYEIKYQKISEDYLFKIIESNEI